MIDISGITVSGPHIGSHRSTKYESRTIQVGPNGVALDAVERGVFGSKPIQLEVPETLYTPEQIAVIHTALSLLDEGFRVVHDAKEEELLLAGIAIPRAEVHKLVEAAEAAKTDRQTEQIAIAGLALERKAIEAQIAAKRAELEALSAAASDAQSAEVKADG